MWACRSMNKEGACGFLEFSFGVCEETQKSLISPDCLPSF